MRFLKKFIVSMLLLLWFPAGCTVSGITFFRIHARDFKEPVLEDSIPDQFPVLVLIRSEDNEYEPHMVSNQNLEDFLAQLEDYTFLVPDGQQKSLNAQIQDRERSNMRGFVWESPEPWSAWFKVEQLDAETQMLEVFSTWDHDRSNKGWYEAREKEFVPLEYESFSVPDMVMRTVTEVFLLMGGLCAVIFLARRARKKRKGEAPAESSISE